MKLTTVQVNGSAARGAAVLLLATFLANGQQPPIPAPKTPDFSASTRVVVAHVTVTDVKDNFISGLKPEEFRLFDNGKPQKFNEDTALHEISMVVAIETSSTVAKILPQVRKIGSLLTTLVAGEGGELAVLGFDQDIQVLTPFTADPDLIAPALMKLKTGTSSSRLNDAAMEAVSMLRTRPPNRKRVLLLISQTRDNGSKAKVRDVLMAEELANISVYSVDMSHVLAQLTATPQPPRPQPVPPEARTLPAGVPGTPTTDAQTYLGDWTPLLKDIFVQSKSAFVDSPVKAYTKFTGGREFSFDTQRTLEKAISDVGEELHSQHMLTYQLASDAESGFHQIVVRVLRPGLKVRARSGYWISGPEAGK